MKCLELVAGFDPGGQGKFGWCIAQTSPPNLSLIEAGIANHAMDAFCKVKKSVAEQSGELIAAGIDAPLYWPYTGQSRASDKYVRKQINPKSKGSAGTVQAVNSLRGACLAQGIMIAAMIEKKYPACRITETHPKALLVVCPGAKQLAGDGKTEHERDAIISAWAAAQYASNNRRNLYDCKNKTAIHDFLKEPWYWWPCGKP